MAMLRYIIYIFLLAGAALSIVLKKLTVAAGMSGALVGLFIYKGCGYTGIIMLALFFILGSAFTGWRAEKKQALGIVEKDKGRRTTGQVLANGGCAAILGAIALYQPQQALILQLMMAGSLASATADTLSSELGAVYGRRFYDVISFKKVPPGPDGVVSLEGTLIGIAGAGLIALVYAVGFGFNYGIFIIIAAGATGNLTDSLLGATLERLGLIGNNTVNFLNTCAGAAVSLLLHWLL
jgi:uncharacterized protein (TIGR00297 family)